MTTETRYWHMAADVARTADYPGKYVVLDPAESEIREAMVKHPGKIAYFWVRDPHKLCLSAEVVAGATIVISASRIRDWLQQACEYLRQALLIWRPDEVSAFCDEFAAVADERLVVDMSELVGELDDDLVRDMARRYLHDPRQHLPIEPFHSILLAFCNDRDYSLRARFLGDLGSHVFVDAAGRVALSGGDLAAGRLLGMAHQPSESWQRSEAWRARLAQMASDRFAKLPCATCRYFFICQGQMSANRRHCEAWIRVFDFMRDNADEVLSLRRIAEQSGYQAP